MNLLPKSKKEFATKSYWETFFDRRKDAFEWYGEYSDLSDILGKYCKLTDDILMAGCGNSNLSEDMYNLGYHGIINIDISDVVLKQMNIKNKERMAYLKMDMKKTTFDDESFHVIIDKGTLDAIFTDDNDIVTADVRTMFNEILRVLKVGGRYICVTLAQQHILNELFSFFQNLCFIRVHQIECNKGAIVAGGLGGHLPVFAFICTKMKTELLTPVLELVLSGKSSIEKFKDTEAIKNQIKMLQNFALVKNKLQNSTLCENLTVDLWVDEESFKEPRYSITVVDVDKSELSTYSGEYAVFIVPQGRENETMFALESGRKQLAEAAGFSRLAITYLHRGHLYKDLDEIKAQLSENVMDLAPSHVDKNHLVPFLSTSSDIGSRVIVCESMSPIYGSFVIEDIQSVEKYYYRQLVFTDECDKIQEKVRLKLESKKKKSKKRIADCRYLMEGCEKNMLAGFSFLSNIDFRNPERIDVLIIGLCGGAFIGFILDLFPGVYITCVAIDATMINISKNWFGLLHSDKLTFISQDIATFLSDCLRTEKSLYDIVIIDHIPAKSPECSLELSEEVFLNIERTIKATGLFCILIKNASKRYLQNVFPIHYVSEIENTILQFSIKGQSNNDDTLEQAKLKVIEITNYITCKRNGFYDKDEWSILDDFIENLVVL